MSGYKLYTFYLSSTAWRARIALNLKDIKPEYIFIDLFKGDQNKQQYKKINPNTGVPSLLLPNGTTLVESIAIIEYLNEIKPNPYNLYPGDAIRRAQIRAFCEVINSGIHPYQNLRLAEKVEKELGMSRTEWIPFWVQKGVETLEKIMDQNSEKSRFCFGEEITAADVVFFPQIFATKNRWNIDLTPYTNVCRVFENLSQIKEFMDAAPKNQPDYPGSQ